MRFPHSQHSELAYLRCTLQKVPEICERSAKQYAGFRAVLTVAPMQPHILAASSTATGYGPSEGLQTWKVNGEGSCLSLELHKINGELEEC